MGLPPPSRGIVRLDPCTAARAGAAILVCPTALEDEHEPSARLCGDGDLASVSFVLLRKFARSSSKNFVDWTLPAPKLCSGPPQTMFRHLPHAAPLLQDRRVVRSRRSRKELGSLSTAACMCTRQMQSPRSRNEARRLCRATPSGCGVVQCANVKLVERARHLQDYFRMRCRGSAAAGDCLARRSRTLPPGSGPPQKKV